MAIALSSLRRTSERKPPRIVCMGVHGIGKSTFAAGAEKAVFIPTEDGLTALDATAFPLCRTVEEVMGAVQALYVEEHDFKTVVLDSADWCEALIHKKVAQANGVPTLEAIGYGKGYRYALDDWRNLLEGLDALRNDKGMAVVILAHVKVKRFDDPANEPYDRYLLDLHDSAAALLSEWCDILAFANYRVSISKTDVGFNKKVARGVGSGERILYTQQRPGFSAKSRYTIPDELPLEWTALREQLDQQNTERNV